MQKQVKMLKQAMTADIAKPHVSDLADGDFDNQFVMEAAKEENALENLKHKMARSRRNSVASHHMPDGAREVPSLQVFIDLPINWII